MERSTSPLLSEEELVEIAGRMLAGEYKTITGFSRDLAVFLLSSGKPAISRNNNHCGEIIFLSDIEHIESIISGEVWRGIAGLRPEKLH